MKNALELYDGLLELGDIASKQLSSAQFAFLSACHAAAGLKDIPGEAMHLAAGLQFAGFPSVIATMWSISDDDAATWLNIPTSIFSEMDFKHLTPLRRPQHSIAQHYISEKIPMSQWTGGLHSFISESDNTYESSKFTIEVQDLVSTVLKWVCVKDRNTDFGHQQIRIILVLRMGGAPNTVRS